MLKFRVNMTSSIQFTENPSDAENVALLIRRTGARATPTRVRVLSLLRTAPVANRCPTA